MMRHVPRTHSVAFHKVSLCCTFLKTTTQWSRWSSKEEVQWWDTCPEPTGSRRLVVWLNRFGPQNPNQIHWHQEPTRRHVIRWKFHDEWGHLVRLFDIMNFWMFSCSHFLSIKKPNTMSKRAQERRTGEELAVAKSKPVSLVSRSLSAKQSSSLDSGAPYSLGNQGLCRNSVFTITERLVRDRVQNPTVISPEWQREMIIRVQALENRCGL